MGNLIKYEWKKQRTARLVILSCLIVSLVLLLCGLLFQNDMLVAFGTMIITLSATLSVFYLGIESLVIYNRDLRTKQSYMLFMVPKSTWEILGAKFIAAILQMFFAFVMYFAAAVAFVSIAAVSEGGTKEYMNLLGRIFERLSQVDWMVVFQLCLFLFIAWVSVIMTGFLAITLSRTVLLNSRFSGLISIVLFFIINFVIERMYGIITRFYHNVGSDSFSQIKLPDYGFYILICLLLFFVSGWIAEKKLSI